MRKLVVLFVLALCGLAFAAQAVTVQTVAELVAALEAVNDGGSDTTINVEPGTYDVSAVHMNADAHLYVAKTCTIQGTDATAWSSRESRETSVIFDAKDVSRIFLVDKNVSKAQFKHLTFQNGHARENTETPPEGWAPFTDNYPRGGAIALGVSGASLPSGVVKPWVTNCVFRAGRAKQGGGTYNCRVSQCFFTNNVTESCGSAVIAGEIYGCLIVGNTASNGNGAARNCNPIRDSVFINNYAGSKGGAAFGGSSTVSNCVFIGNQSVGQGGALCAENPATHNWTARNCVFIGNYAKGIGGACYGIRNVYDCAFTNNVSKQYGGALHTSTNHVQRCTFFGNSATNATYGGGAAYNCFIDNCTFTSNIAVLGGAAYNCVIDHSTFVSNYAESGGATYGGTNELCTFEGNSAKIQGGGAYMGEQRLCTFVGNRTFSADWQRGGAGCHSASLVTGCTFRLNVATDQTGVTNAYGGGVMLCPDVRNCYFERNYAAKGGAGCISSLFDCVITNCSSAVDWGDGANAVGMNGDKNRFPSRIERCKIYDCRGVGAGAGKSGAIIGMIAVDCEIWGGAIYRTSATRCTFRKGTADSVTFIADGDSTANVNEKAIRKSSLTNCLIADLTCTLPFRGITELVNCTVADVSTTQGLIGSASFVGVNTLFAGNSVNGEPCDISVSSGTSSFNLTNCLYRTASSSALSAIRGTGNIQIPAARSYGFVGTGAEHPPYSLLYSSPAREQGLAFAWDGGATDLAGNPRLNGTVDIGCYECYLPPVGTIILFK